jgi:hypothetical protein
VLQEQIQQRIALLGRPAMPRAGLADGAFADVAAGQPTTGDEGQALKHALHSCACDGVS